MTKADDNGPKKFGKFLKKIVDLPAALASALTVARVIEDRKISTPWRGKLLRVQLVQMKDQKRYVQLLLVDGDVDMRVALDVVGASELQGIVNEFLPKMADFLRGDGDSIDQEG